MSFLNCTINCEFSSSASLTDIVITSDSSALSSKLNPSDSTHRLIKYDTIINRPNNYHFHEISFDDIGKYNFNNNAFIEVIKSPDYVHLYFDFDSMLTLKEKQREKDNKNKGINEIIVSDDEQMERFDCVIQWLDSLNPVFGEYSLGGYTSNEDVKNKYHLRLYKEGNHFISVHIIFYQTMLKASELEEIMKHTAKQGFIYDGINQFADTNVYSIVKHENGKGGTRKFRHELSNKIFTTNKNDKYYKGNRFNHGTIINDLKPSTQIIQVRGDEKIIDRNQWSKQFKQRSLHEARDDNKLKNFEQTATFEGTNISFDKQNVASIDCTYKRIELTDDEFDELLSNFPCEFDYLKIIVCILLHSPFDKERIHTIFIFTCKKTKPLCFSI